MLTTLPFFSRNRFLRIGLIGLVCALGVSASACGGAVSTPSTPTPSTTVTVVGGIPTTGALTSTPALGSTSAASIVDACALATTPEVETVFGQPVIAMKPGIDPNSIPGRTSYFCTYLGGGLALVLSVVDMGSPDAALTELNTLVDNMRTGNPSATITQESGLGDRAFWTSTGTGCGYNVLKGSTIFTVTLGSTISDPSTRRGALLDLTHIITTRI